ncbi:MAG TPA: TIGR03790 family protein [Fimbriimonadaceae bacterium]|nr:TIGR03790 family protein [Fimbriimonadaceae bacterium]
MTLIALACLALSRDALSATYLDAARVLVVYNGASPQGREIAAYYAERRRVPASNVLRITCPDGEEVSEASFRASIQAPIQRELRKNRNPIDFIVLTKGVPIRLQDEEGYSVDAWVMAGNLPIPPIRRVTSDDLTRCLNPYFRSTLPFSSRRFGFRLVTRLDGYTVADCKALVDRSLEARPEKGPFLFDEAANRNTADYGPIQQGLAKAAQLLEKKAFDVDLQSSGAFVAPPEKLAGYASWGSNDADFELSIYRRLRFKPGALCETFVSTSGRTFEPTLGGQSLIADLIANGATGAKGYVSEPYTFALAKPEILFDRYTSGLNLAESFYSASQFLKWKDIVIGDPLCDPYRGMSLGH